jgi:hypothetical protein
VFRSPVVNLPHKRALVKRTSGIRLRSPGLRLVTPQPIQNSAADDAEESCQGDDDARADFTVVRALLKRGRGYEDAVKTFEPYREVQEPNEGARAGMVEIVKGTMKRKLPAFLYVNNRLEGNAPGTIEAVVGDL